MPSLPTGTVTFLFTDIEGSTRLAESRSDWPTLLDAHRTIIRAAIAAGGGTEVGTEGDSFFVAFPTAAGAVGAAVAVQRGLAAHPWPDGAQVRVRMGLHTGEGTLAGDDYVGIDVHRAARIAAAGHGGQILLSDATRVLAEGNLPERATLRDAGLRRLKDLSRPEQIHELLVSGLQTDFPPLRTLDVTPNNLPIQLSSFLGRERELADIAALLEKTRLLTLTGPGGTGKSRLSLQIGARVADRFADGVFWVPLATLRDPDLLPGTIAQELGLPDRGGLTPMTALITHLRERRMLLILDNFEQVTNAAPAVSELLAAAPGLTVLATSRSGLRIYGEREYPVPPLATPDPRRHETVESLSQYEAVALFIERAMAVKPDFTVTNENAPAVAEISSRLDGLPLAIELAAARINVLTPQAMLARLGDRLSLLSGGGRDRPERQQTLRGAIDWSYELLSEDERALFRRLSVFVGGARLEAIDSVCPGEELNIDILEGLSSLVDKSLLRQVPAGDGEPRFVMLGTIREYALQRLVESGHADDLHRRHAEHFAGLVAQAMPELLGPEKRRWLDWLEEDHDNLRAAIDWSLDTGETVLALRLVAGLWRFWQMRGYLAEGSQRAGRALALPDVPDHPLEHADALEAAGGIAWWLADFAGAIAAYRACLELREQIGDPKPLAEAYYNLSFPLGFGVGIAEGAELDEAYRMIASALRISTEIGDKDGIAKAEWAYLTIGWRDRDFETARKHGEAALPLFRELGDQFLLGWSLYDMGLIDLHDARLDVARERLAESLAIFRDVKDVSGYTLVLDAFASLAMATGDLDRAARLSGAVANLERLTGTGLNRANRILVGYDPAQLHDRPELLGAWEEGSGLTIDDAIAYALELKAPPAETAAAAPPTPS